MVGLALVGLLTLRDTRLTDTPAAPVLSCYVTWPLKEPILAMPFYDLLLARRPKIQRFPHDLGDGANLAAIMLHARLFTDLPLDKCRRPGRSQTA